MIAIVGPPGAGKTTGCEYFEECGGVMGYEVLGMDGFHHYREDLKQMETNTSQFLKDRPKYPNAVYERGADYTFDKNGLVSKLIEIRQALD